ncbi:MAG: protoporphyrinogen oxidase [Acidimicrobiales bacterium]
MRVAVVGAGIAGLSAAWELRDHAEVHVFDPDPPGGKLRTSDFCGRPVDEGPDAFITRVPEALQLCAELGMADELVAPAAGRTLLWTGGRLRPLPEGLMLGVPGRLWPVAASGLLSPAGMLRATLDLVLPALRLGDDIGVGELVTRRFGVEVAERLVEPLLGGIHAARLGELSAEVTAPQLLAAARRSRSLLLGLRDAGTSTGADSGPLFLAPRGGMASLVDRLVSQLGVARVTLHRSGVAAMEMRGAGVVLDGAERFDAVVLAVAASDAGGLLGPAAPAELAQIAFTTVAVVTLAFPTGAVHLPEGISGFLVPAGDRPLTTACSFGSTKWPHWAAPGHDVLRVSCGRSDDSRAAALADEELVGRVTAEVAAALGGRGTPVEARVSRWPVSFPLYRPGHAALVRAAEESLRRHTDRVRLAGSSYRGAGIPACIASGRQAARHLLTRGTASPR